MIPILYPANETTFTTNGLGGLSDSISCTVTEERNGAYELKMQYPIDGLHFSDIAINRIIWAIPAQNKTGQAFRIYRITKPISGICTIYAEHISYELNYIPVMPFTAYDCANALQGLVDNAIQDCPFSVWTDKRVTTKFSFEHPMQFRDLLGGTQGSILDTYGTAEYEFDNWTVNLYLHRGHDSGAVIRYGKNLTDLTQDETIAKIITGICPYYEDAETGTIVTLPEYAVWSPTYVNYPYKRTEAVSFNDMFDKKPTVAQLRKAANQYIEDNNIGIPSTSLSVKFVPLSQVNTGVLSERQNTLMLPDTITVNNDTVDVGNTGTMSGDTLTLNISGLRIWQITYTDYVSLERINLCDTVTISYPALGVNAKAKVIKTEYDVLQERYSSLEIGDTKTDLASQMVDLANDVKYVSEQNNKKTAALKKTASEQEARIAALENKVASLGS